MPDCKGPFRSERFDDAAGPTVVGKGAVVLDVAGNQFCWVIQSDCAGGDQDAAKARAQRIAESMNRTEGHLAALERLVRAGLEIQKWRGGAAKASRFDHERELDDALLPFEGLVA